MRRNVFAFGFAWIVCLSASLMAAADKSTFSVAGAVGKPGDWTVDRVEAELGTQVTSISYQSHGKAHSATAVPLIAVLKASGVDIDPKMDPAADPKTKLRPLRLVVIVQGRDGYAVAFSMAELLTGFGDRPTWLAMDVDGQPLPDADGPVRVIVPDDKKPARWVRGLANVTVVDLSGPTTRPG